MNALWNASITHQHSLPYIILITVGIGCVLALLVGMGVGALSEKKAKQKALKAVQGTPEDAHKEESIPLFAGRWAEILASHGLFKVGPVTQTFLKILEILRKHVYGKNWRYQVPWYMLVGAPQSGKSTLAENLRSLPMPGYDTIDIKGAPFRSFLFESGVLIETPGSAVGGVGSMGISHTWKLFGRLLTYLRPRAPLEGVVLTLPYDKLAEKEPFPGQKAQEAQHLFEHLWWLQSAINMRIPVYVIITKSDKMPGFSALCAQLPFANRQQIFGWSSPYDLQTSFSPSWIDEAFEVFLHGIKRATLSIATHAPPSEILEKALFVGREIQAIQETVRTYLSVLFRPFSEGSGLLLRGVYFTGQETNPVIHPLPSVDLSALNPENFQVNARTAFWDKESRVYFSQDLFDTKIFQETHLARPLRLNLVHGTTKATPWIRGLMVASVAVLLLGGHQAHNTLHKKSADLESMLGLIKDLIVKLRTVEKHVTTPEDQAHLTRETREMLLAMNTMDPHLSYFFLPASWFSRLEKHISDMLILTFDHVVLRAMYLDLTMNVRTIHEKMTKKVKQDDKQLVAVLPTETEEYKVFKEYVQKFLEIEKGGAHYNLLQKREDRAHIRALTSYLFNIDFTATELMNGRKPNAHINFQEFNIKKYAPEARTVLVELYTRFLHRLFAKETWQVISALGEKITQLASILHHPTAELTAKQVADLASKMQSLLIYTKDSSLDWWGREHFDPGGDYVQTMSLMEDSDVLGRKFVKNLLQRGEKSLKAFRRRLIAIETPLTGRFFSHRKGDIVLGPSPGFVRLTQDLQKLLAEPFMVSAKSKELKTVIPKGKILYWDTRILKEAARLIDAYTDFTGTRLDTFDEEMREIYEDIAHRILTPVVQTLTAQAQLFEDENDARVSASSMEERLRLQTANLRDATAYFSKILRFLDHVRSRRMYDGRLTVLILELAYRLLEQVDDILEADGPYTAKGNLFSSWNGRDPANYAGFQVHDSSQLQNYLSAQRERIRFLAKDLADPLITLLAIDPLCKQKHNSDLLKKWRELIKQVDDYDKKKPGNSIAVLENFVTTDLKNVDPKASKKIFENVSKESGDFFLDQRADMARALLSRAEEVSAEMALIYYQEIAEHFHDTLEDRFPFSDDVYTTEPDATIASIEKLTQLYDVFAADVQFALEGQPRPTKDEKRICACLESFAPVQSFLKLLVANEKTHDPAAAILGFRVQFRVMQEQEVFGEQIVEWKVKWGKNTIDVASPQKEIIWHIGDPLEVVFRWANNSHQVPVLDKVNPALGVFGKTAAFSYGGKMALFRLIAAHAVPRQDTSGEGVTLKFVIPTVTRSGNSRSTASGNAVVYIKLTPLKKEKDKWVPIEFPVFPSSFPKIAGAKGRHVSSK
ncbi:MAG: hypothetical protein LBD15_04115 [Holosporales bacterium]|jgi:type VI secretion system protein ImpL|nr:hypothetical protein [Holosporales bacterium]